MICRFSAWGWFYSKLNIQLPCTVHLKNADFTKNAQSTENILIWWRALHSLILVSADQCWSLRKLLFFFFLARGPALKKHLKGQLSGSKWHVFNLSNRTSDMISLKEFLMIYSHAEKGMLFHLFKTGCLDLFLHFWSATTLLSFWNEFLPAAETCLENQIDNRLREVWVKHIKRLAKCPFDEPSLRICLCMLVCSHRL